MEWWIIGEVESFIVYIKFLGISGVVGGNILVGLVKVVFWGISYMVGLG